MEWIIHRDILEGIQKNPLKSIAINDTWGGGV